MSLPGFIFYPFRFSRYLFAYSLLHSDCLSFLERGIPHPRSSHKSRPLYSPYGRAIRIGKGIGGRRNIENQGSPSSSNSNVLGCSLFPFLSLIPHVSILSGYAFLRRRTIVLFLLLLLFNILRAGYPPLFFCTFIAILFPPNFGTLVSSEEFFTFGTWTYSRASIISLITIGLALPCSSRRFVFFFSQAPVLSSRYFFRHHDRTGVSLLIYLAPFFFFLLVYSLVEPLFRRHRVCSFSFSFLSLKCTTPTVFGTTSVACQTRNREQERAASEAAAAAVTSPSRAQMVQYIRYLGKCVNDGARRRKRY